MGRQTTSSSPTITTYYEILEVAPDASNLEIKKAYRRLALLHHPDRNNGSPESKERFQQIGEAFQCLGDPIRRRDYDANLRQESHQSSFANSNNYPAPSSSSNAGASSGGSPFDSKAWSSPFYPSQPQHSPSYSADHTASGLSGRRRQTMHRPGDAFDAYAQFDYLFREDPFFQEAFKDMDEEFARRFTQEGAGRHPTKSTNTSPSSTNHNKNVTSVSPRNMAKSKEGWIPWLLRQCGIEFQMTTYAVDGRGGTTRTSYSSKGRSVYTQKVSESYRDRQGRLVTVQCIEQNGNQIEDRLVNNRLVQRRVNGVVEPLERIADW